MPTDPRIPAHAVDTRTILWRRWSEHAREKPGAEAVVHWVAGEEPYRWTWGSLLESAREYARALVERGVKPGHVCALVLRHHREFYPLYLGVSAVGALPAVLAYPNPRLHPDKFRQGLEGMAQRSGLDWLLTERELEPIVRPLALHAGSTIREILFPIEPGFVGRAESVALPDPPVTPDLPCLLQHSSGTTGLQKAVTLSHRAVLEHVNRYAQSIDLRPDDRVVSWLPLYHDMGLIAAFHLPLAFGIPVVQIDPFEWVSMPSLMLEAIAKEKGTIAWLPNFSYNFMADRINDEDLEGVRLDSVRVLVNCSEPVRYDSHDRFARRFERLGLKRSALTACYAMAETTFAVTQSAPNAEALRLSASRDELARGFYRTPKSGETTRDCVSSGRPISGCEVRVVGTAGDDLPDDAVGELFIRSVSLFDGYRNNPEKTAEAMSQGWYRSGDYGFRHAGEFYVIGRKKDIIIVAGKNLYPEDIEDAVNTVPGVAPGRVIAFGYDDPDSGTEQVCVVAEAEAQEPAARQALRLAIVEAGMKIDVTISRVYLVPLRWLVKSSSGKPSRSANRQRVLDELRPV